MEILFISHETSGLFSKIWSHSYTVIGDGTVLAMINGCIATCNIQCTYVSTPQISYG